MNQAQRMDSIYRYQRYIYDFTRKYFLIGRDQLLPQMHIRDSDKVLEIGCGTARNLLALARLHPHATLYGLDVSEEMLRTARTRIRQSGHSRIHVTRCSAEEVDYRATFGLDSPFDVIFFSYSLSMIPVWKQALDRAISNLTPQGSIYIVDFWDQGGFPIWFRRLLTSWLKLFHVRHEPELLKYLYSFETDGYGVLRLQSVTHRYAFLAHLSHIRRNP